MNSPIDFLTFAMVKGIYVSSRANKCNVYTEIVMFNLYRISYVVYALELLKDQSTTEKKVLLLYDVACLLKRHLQVHVDVYMFVT